MFRTWAEGRAANPGVLSDYAFLAAGLLDLYETTHDSSWLREAIAMMLECCPFCIAGMTCSVAIAATPITPHRSFFIFSALLLFAAHEMN